ncbi:MAG: hypothetical protein J7K66_03290 [Anaerolineaceae bacterium]|nr:hypothetical protein [Anaerolineaceae bacterium]
MIIKINPQPHPMHDPLLYPNRSCIQSKALSNKKSFNKPAKHPGRRLSIIIFLSAIVYEI